MVAPLSTNRDVVVEMMSVVVRYCKSITEVRRERHSHSENNG